MKFSWNAILQAIMVTAQGINAFVPMLPPDAGSSVTLGLAAVQGVIAFVAHFRNPDGTTARMAYHPPMK